MAHTCVTVVPMTIGGRLSHTQNCPRFIFSKFSAWDWSQMAMVTMVVLFYYCYCTLSRDGSVFLQPQLYHHFERASHGHKRWRVYRKRFLRHQDRPHLPWSTAILFPRYSTKRYHSDESVRRRCRDNSSVRGYTNRICSTKHRG